MSSAWIPPTLDKIFVTLGSTLRSLHIFSQWQPSAWIFSSWNLVPTVFGCADVKP